jgi:hypothetical protein
MELNDQFQDPVALPLRIHSLAPIRWENGWAPEKRKPFYPTKNQWPSISKADICIFKDYCFAFMSLAMDSFLPKFHLTVKVTVILNSHLHQSQVPDSNTLKNIIKLELLTLICHL